jgi:hypothetical protein
VSSQDGVRTPARGEARDRNIRLVSLAENILGTLALPGAVLSEIPQLICDNAYE